MKSRHVGRDTLSDFNPSAFYTFINTDSPNKSLSVIQDTELRVNTTLVGVTSSSENWQIFYQQGRYFIRNYDYGGDWQLGLSLDSRSVPRLMKRSGSVGQQWSLTKTSGMWRFTNGLLGNGSMLALTSGNTVPGMQASETGTVWDIVINTSAGEPKGASSYTQVEDFEVIQSSSSTGSSTSLSTSTESSTTTPTAGALLPGASNPTLPADASPLQPSAIAGICVGAVVIVIIAAIAWFLWFKRRNSKKAAAVEMYAHQGYNMPPEQHAPPPMYEAPTLQAPSELGDGPGKYRHEHRVELA